MNYPIFDKKYDISILFFEYMLLIHFIFFRKMYKQIVYTDSCQKMHKQTVWWHFNYFLDSVFWSITQLYYIFLLYQNPPFLLVCYNIKTRLIASIAFHLSWVDILLLFVPVRHKKHLWICRTLFIWIIICRKYI